MAYSIFYFLVAYVVVIAICLFCYWRILIAFRRQARVMASHNAAGPSTAQQAQSSQIQSSIIKTMILVCAFYAVAWLPMNVYYLLMNVHPSLNLSPLDSAYYFVIFMAFLYTCAKFRLTTVERHLKIEVSWAGK